MKVSVIINLINAKLLTETSEDVLNKTLSSAFASDLMSDVLAYVNEDILLITGLAHVQTLRTAEMLDIQVVLFARGKTPDETVIELAKQNNIILLQTAYTTYEVSGILYQAGLPSINCC